MDTMNTNPNETLSESILNPVETLPENKLNSDENLSENKLNSDGNSSEQSSNFKSKFSKKKIGIIAGIVVLLIVLAIILFSQIGKKAIPLVPEKLELGMTMDEVSKILETVYKDPLANEWGEYDPFDKHYQQTINVQDVNDEFPNCFPTLIGGSDWVLRLYCNENKKLYKIHWLPLFAGENWDDDKNNICTYLEKNIGEGIIESTPAHKQITYIGNGFTVEIYEGLLSSGRVLPEVNIISEEYAPQIPEISDEAILSALNDYVYDAGGFAVPLPTLVNKCMKNQSFTPIRVSYFMSDAIKQSVLETYSEHASTSYLVRCAGDICQNPQVPWMMTKDITILKLLLIFDDNGNLVDSKVIDSCSELNTCATILWAEGI